MNELIILLVSAIFVNNIVLAKFLGLCPFFGVSTKTASALSMGIAVTLVMVAATLVTWLIYHLILQPFNIGYLQTITFILVIASFVQLTEIILKKTSPLIYSTLGVYLPLITTNCAILGTTFISIKEEYELFPSLIYSFATGLGFILALLLMSGIRERLELNEVPKAMRGLPIAFITGALLSLIFLGFSGMV